MEKLVAIDIDGTLLDSNSKITPEVYEAVKQSRGFGVHIALCSGRPVFGLKHVLEMLPPNSIEYVITHNGAMILEVDTKKVVFSKTLNVSDFNHFNRICEQLGMHLCFHDLDGVYTLCKEMTNGIARNVLSQKCVMHILDQIPPNQEILKMQFIEDTEEDIDVLLKAIPPNLFEEYSIVRSVRDNLEVMDKSVNKWTGISKLASLLGITEKNTVGIGDEENDREMLENVGLSIVMENGSDSVKKLADIITKSNDESGVAYALNRFIFPKTAFEHK